MGKDVRLYKTGDQLVAGFFIAIFEMRIVQ